MAVGLYILFNKDKKVKIISPTFTQSSIIMNYIADFIVKSEDLRVLVEFDATGVERLKKQVTKSRITFKNGCEIQLLSAEGEAKRLMGFGGDLIIQDETNLIDLEVYQTRISRMAGDNPNAIIIEIGNPFDKLNHFWEHWNSPKYHKIHIPYTMGLQEGRISQSFIDSQREELTPLQFKILYDAEFPEDTENTLILSEWLKKAQRPVPDVKGTCINILGIDVARMGEDSTVFTYTKVYQHLFVIKKIIKYDKKTITQTVGNIIQFIKDNPVNYIHLDDTGLGSGVLDGINKYIDEHYKELSIVPEIVPMVLGSTAIDSPHNLNHKSDIFMYLRKQFEKGSVIIPEYSELISQLSKFQYEITDNGKLKIIENQTKSPDLADSLAYSCYYKFEELIFSMGGNK